MLFIVMVLFILCFLLFFRLKKYPKEKVIISKDSCSVKEGFLNISMKTRKGYKIFYTLDGSIQLKIVLDIKTELP